MERWKEKSSNPIATVFPYSISLFFITPENTDFDYCSHDNKSKPRTSGLSLVSLYIMGWTQSKMGMNLQRFEWVRTACPPGCGLWGRIVVLKQLGCKFSFSQNCKSLLLFFWVTLWQNWAASFTSYFSFCFSSHCNLNHLLVEIRSSTGFLS